MLKQILSNCFIWLLTFCGFVSLKLMRLWFFIIEFHFFYLSNDMNQYLYEYVHFLKIDGHWNWLKMFAFYFHYSSHVTNVLSWNFFFAVSASWWSFHHVLFKKKDTLVYEVFPGNLSGVKITLYGSWNCVQRWRKTIRTCNYGKNLSFSFNDLRQNYLKFNVTQKKMLCF